MDEEIVIDRGNTTVMKLDADEQALMDEIEISAHRAKPVRRPTSNRPPPQQPQQQEAMDAFVNPNKQSAPTQPQQEDEIDYGEDDDAFFDDANDGPQFGMQEERPSKGYSSIDEEKADHIQY